MDKSGTLESRNEALYSMLKILCFQCIHNSAVEPERDRTFRGGGGSAAGTAQLHRARTKSTPWVLSLGNCCAEIAKPVDFTRSLCVDSFWAASRSQIPVPQPTSATSGRPDKGIEGLDQISVC